MSWSKHHTESENYASQAEEFDRRHNQEQASKYFRLAAEAEIAALADLAPNKTRTIGITVVSAVSLYRKAQEFLLANEIAEKWLSAKLLEPFAIEELKKLNQIGH